MAACACPSMCRCNWWSEHACAVIARGAMAHGWGAGIHISDSAQLCSSGRCARGGRGRAVGRGLCMCECRMVQARSERNDRTGLERRVRPGWSVMRGGWLVDDVGEKAEGKWQHQRRAGGSFRDSCAARGLSGRCDRRTHRQSPAATMSVGGSVSAASIVAPPRGDLWFVQTY